MATYKLIQDIEAEDKILGPLTLRQFIFALVAVFFGYICFLCLAKGATFLLLIFAPPMLFCAFFAFPFGKDQPTELWALAKLNYWFKPRKRIWNQSGVKELVTITVPKKVEHIYTNGLSQTEVQSRLQALASTIDSRGWAIKNVNVNTYTALPFNSQNSDRLIEMSNLPQDVPTYQVAAADDMLDEVNNPIAQKFDTLINQASQQHRQQLMEQLKTAPVPVAVPQATAAPEPWFLSPSQPVSLHQPTAQSPAQSQAVIDANQAAEAALSSQLKAQAASTHGFYDNLRTLHPSGPPVQAVPPPTANPTPSTSPAVTPPTLPSTSAQAVTAPTDPAILSLAKNNDLNVATLAREANKVRTEENQVAQDEVVISLH